MATSKRFRKRKADSDLGSPRKKRASAPIIDLSRSYLEEKSIDALYQDLQPLVPRVLAAFKTWPPALVRHAVRAYARFLLLKAHFDDYDATAFSPPLALDEIWHLHLLDTKLYAKVCTKHLGGFVHHNPDGGKDAKEQERRRLAARGHMVDGIAKHDWSPVESIVWRHMSASSTEVITWIRMSSSAKRSSSPSKPPKHDFIFCKTLTGTLWKVRSEGIVTVDDLVRKISDEFDEPYATIRLLYAGQELQNSDLLSDKGIVSESTVHMYQQLRGC